MSPICINVLGATFEWDFSQASKAASLKWLPGTVWPDGHARFIWHPRRYHALMTLPQSPPDFPDGHIALSHNVNPFAPSLLKVLGLIFGVAVLAFAFAQLGSEVLAGETRSFDLHALQTAALLRSSHGGLTSVMRDLSGMGSIVVLTLVTVATVGYLALVNARVAAIVVASAVGSGAVLVSVFKATFGRLRPDIAFAALQESSLRLC